MPRNSREVFYKLVDKKSHELDNIDIVGLLSYGIFEDNKHDWINHHEKQTNRSITQEEIDHWIEQHTEKSFQKIKDEAIQVFGESASVFMQDTIEKAKQEAANNAIVSILDAKLGELKGDVFSLGLKIKKSGNFLRQLGLTLIASIIVPIILGASVAAVLIYKQYIPSVIQIG